MVYGLAYLVDNLIATTHLHCCVYIYYCTAYSYVHCYSHCSSQDRHFNTTDMKYTVYSNLAFSPKNVKNCGHAGATACVRLRGFQ